MSPAKWHVFHFIYTYGWNQMYCLTINRFVFLVTPLFLFLPVFAQGRITIVPFTPYWPPAGGNDPRTSVFKAIYFEVISSQIYIYIYIYWNHNKETILAYHSQGLNVKQNTNTTKTDNMSIYCQRDQKRHYSKLFIYDWLFVSNRGAMVTNKRK